MAFMGIFMMWLIPFLIFLGVCNTVAIVCFIIAAVVKHKYKKRAAADPSVKKPISPIILKITGWLFLLPLIGTVGLIGTAVIHTEIENRNSLWYNVNNGNFKRVEQLIDKGASPNCTKESNEPAQNGEESILVILCRHHGFTTGLNDDDTKDRELTDDEKKMILLLIEKGADLEYKYYRHEEHDIEGTSSYAHADKCGRTPFLWAVTTGDYELVKLLADNGADINAKDVYGYNGVAIVADELNDERGLDILQYLLDKGVEKDYNTKLGPRIWLLAERNREIGNEKIRELIPYEE